MPHVFYVNFSESKSILAKLYIFLSEMARPSKKDTTSCRKSLAPEPCYLV